MQALQPNQIKHIFQTERTYCVNCGFVPLHFNDTLCFHVFLSIEDKTVKKCEPCFERSLPPTIKCKHGAILFDLARRLTSYSWAVLARPPLPTPS